MANPEFGFIVSESGGGYTWAVNSGENRLTPWCNDPVTDQPGEVLYLRDEETAEVWSPTPPVRSPGPYLIRHGAGYTIFEHNSHGLASAAAPVRATRHARSRSSNCGSKTLGSARAASPRRSTPNGCSASRAMRRAVRGHGVR